MHALLSPLSSLLSPVEVRRAPSSVQIPSSPSRRGVVDAAGVGRCAGWWARRSRWWCRFYRGRFGGRRWRWPGRTRRRNGRCARVHAAAAVDRTGIPERACRLDRGAPEEFRHLLCGGILRWRLEDREWRRDLLADLRSLLLVLDRRRDTRPARPGNRLGRDRRESIATQCQLRRRCLSLGGWRPHVQEHGAGELGAHRPNRGGSQEFECRVRRRAGTTLGRWR